MIRTVRAAGFAVAACVMAVSAAWSGPLQAVEGDVAPVSAHYLDHAGAAAEVSDFAVNNDGATVATVAAVDADQQAHLDALADQMVRLADGVLAAPRPRGL